MKSFTAFLKKEITEQLRSVMLFILLGIFILLGFMNPLTAKITPWLFDVLSDALAQTGIALTPIEVTAMDSWVQFFKNIPMGLIAFIILESRIFTKEYSSGTLILSLTKGLSRYKVVLSKTIILSSLWTIGYWLCFIITYLCNAFFWDNSIAQNLALAAICWWIFGLFTIALIVLFSVVFSANVLVLAGTFGVVITSYIIGALPKIGKYFPTHLTDGTYLIYGMQTGKDFTAAFVITVIALLFCLAVAIPIFNKKNF